MTIQLTGVCRYCTGRIESGDTCDFCATYVPPNPDITAVFDKATNMIELVRHDLAEVLQCVRDDAPLWAAVDLVAALGHLRQAARLIDRAAGRINAPTAAPR